MKIVDLGLSQLYVKEKKKSIGTVASLSSLVWCVSLQNEYDDGNKESHGRKHQAPREPSYGCLLRVEFVEDLRLGRPSASGTSCLGVCVKALCWHFVRDLCGLSLSLLEDAMLLYATIYAMPLCYIFMN